MFDRWVLASLALLAGCATPVEPVRVEVEVPATAQTEPSTEYEKAAVQIWSVDAQHGHCGGFIQSSAVVVTAAHCIPRDTTDVLFRRLGSNLVESAQVSHIERDPRQDIAYLRPDHDLPAHLVSRPVRHGEHGTLLRPLWGTRISGPVENVMFDDGVLRTVLWGEGAHGGDSGSPVIADDGAVIGIVSTGVWAAPGQPITGVTLVPVPMVQTERPR